MKKVIITAGGTSEPIDRVRSITNQSTGSLGASIAKAFSVGKDIKVYYVYNSVIVPEGDNIELIKISTVDDLEEVVTELLTREKIDMFVHAMAVSDFKPVGYVEEGDWGNVKSLGGKISSSSSGDIALVMRRTKKIISIVKEISPKTMLIGFKLLVDVSREELVRVGKGILEKNRCDYVVANDLNGIYGDKHEAILIDENGVCNEMFTKTEIAETLKKLL